MIDTQCRGSLAGLTPEQAAKIVIAYEPVWAIGTGKNSYPGPGRGSACSHSCVAGPVVWQADGDGLRIQYGGSVKADNAAELLRQPNIDALWWVELR